ncbi:MAG: CHAD domain-containing protein [Candidatus Competibacteraceae bacterium]|nr:CHAD domain-containing protein [Candidatus Competibacteraceae bacterium]
MTPANVIAHVKASSVMLTVDSTSEEAFIAIINACLSHALANRPAVLDGQIEGVHQMRVAFRRLRSGFKIFRPLIPREASIALVEDLRWLNGFLGPARDWDVFLAEGLPPIIAHFPRKRSLGLFRTKAEALRQTHQRTLREALHDPRYPRLTQGVAEWLEHRAWRRESGKKQRERLDQSVLDYARPLLGFGARRIVKQGGKFAELSGEERHKLRIRIKELRYALDFFASLYPTAGVKAYLGALAALQDCLGVMNDITVARRLLDEARLSAASPARFLIEGWYGCRLDVHEHAFAELWRRFLECERPWVD